MRNFSKLLGIIALAVIIGFSFAACGDGGGGGGGGGSGGGGGGGGGGKGTFTLTGIPPEYNGMYATCEFLSLSGSGRIFGSQSSSYDKTTSILTITGSKISNGSVNIPLYVNFYDGDNTKRYDRNDKNCYVAVDIYDIQTFNNHEPKKVSVSFSSVTFSNSSAKKSWKDGEVFTY
jgi:hypothetical protein